MYIKSILTMMLAYAALPVCANNIAVVGRDLGVAVSSKQVVNQNPLLTESTLSLHYPRFDLIKNEHFAPAFELGMAQALKEVDAIANNKEKPTFENTIIALEKSGRLLSRVDTIFYNLTSANTNPEMQKLERDLAPKLAAHSDAIRMNAKLFARIDALYNERESLHLDAESQRLLWRYHQDFVRAGAKLSDADKAKLKVLNGEIAKLQTDFTQKTLKEVESSAVFVDTREELAGLSETEIAAAASLAKADGKDGKYEIRLVNTTSQAPLSKLTNRAIRQKLMAASQARGSRGGEYDTRDIVISLAKKRAERATLLGYPSFAAYALADQTAGSVDAVNHMLQQLGPLAVTGAKREAAEMQAIIDKENGGFELSDADWQFYAEKVRQQRYDFDESQLRPYFEFNHVYLDGVFYAATKFYGITFKERHDLPVYEPTVRVFDVYDADGSYLAIYMIDPYARANKKGGAWESPYVEQSSLLGNKTVVANHLNIPQPPKGEPTLLTSDEVRTAFHEFGHALHQLFSNVKYPRFSGTNVPRDFVEYPSQVNEMWAHWPEILHHYARHYQTGEPIPQALLDKVEAASKFNQGFSTTELVASDVIDQAWHQINGVDVPDAAGVMSFEAAALKKAGLDFSLVPPRYRSPYFSHIFMGGYAAGYYSYFWSEVLDADSVEWIKAHGGLTRANGDFFRNTLLSRGGSEDALTLFRNFTGAEPDIGPLLKRRGLE